MDCGLPGSSVHVQGDSSGKNTGMDCHALFQGIFATQGLNPRVSCIFCVTCGFFTTEPPISPGFL